jgi:hypothetical protein
MFQTTGTGLSVPETFMESVSPEQSIQNPINKVYHSELNQLCIPTTCILVSTRTTHCNVVFSSALLFLDSPLPCEFVY